jgi:type II secretory pathway pseudopilin PulG
VTSEARSEYGSTLIEVLIAVVILGLAATTFLFGLSTGAGYSNIGRERADAETYLVSAGEAVKDPTINQYNCVDLPTLLQLPPPLGHGYRLTIPGGPQPPAGWNVRITDVSYWDQLAGPHGSWRPFSDPNDPAWDPCPVGGLRSQGLTITATSPDGEVNLSGLNVKVPTP